MDGLSLIYSAISADLKNGRTYKLKYNLLAIFEIEYYILSLKVNYF